MARRFSTSPRQRRVPAEPGLWILIFGDMIVFALFFGTFGYYRLQEPTVFHAAQPLLNQSLGLLNTLLLLTSSWAVVMAVHAARLAKPLRATRFALAGILLGFGFVAVKALEYSEKFVACLYPTTNTFLMLYFAFTGIHLIHVLIGLGALFFLKSRVSRPLGDNGGAIIEGCAIFWHMVDMLWVVLFAIFYLNR